MTLDQQIQQQAKKLPPEKQAEVMDFIAFLQQQAGILQPAVRRTSLKKHAAFGSWKRRKIDAVKYQQDLRAEWGK
jgi:hypothetical protein